MSSQFLIRGLTLAAALGASACYGKVAKNQGPDVVGEEAQVLVERRQWLKTYDGRCDVCFEAFELCNSGADNVAQEDACQVGLDQCIHGGLVGAEDAGDGDDAAADAGVEESDDDSDEDGAEAGLGKTEKDELKGNVETCIADVRACLDDEDASFQGCVAALKDCVTGALDQAFGAVCSAQIKECVERDAPDDEVRSVEDLCQLGRHAE